MTTSFDSYFEKERLKMLNEISERENIIQSFERKYGKSLREYEIWASEADEEEVEWEDYFEWRSQMNKYRILRREVRRIDKNLKGEFVN